MSSEASEVKSGESAPQEASNDVDDVGDIDDMGITMHTRTVTRSSLQAIDAQASASASADERAPKMQLGLCLYAPEDVRVTRLPMPRIEESSDCIVRVTSTAISAADMHAYAHGPHSDNTLHPPFVLGTECAGIVHAVGPNVTLFKPGDVVTVMAHRVCGACDACKRSEFGGCTAHAAAQSQSQHGVRLSGKSQPTQPVGGGCQAHYVRVPNADINCFAITEGMDDARALLLSDTECTSYYAAAVLGGVKPGDVVCIWGLGAVGLLTARWCKLLGAKVVVGVDTVTERLALAMRHCCHVIDFQAVDVVQTLLSGYSDGIDVAIDCTAFRDNASTSQQLLRRLGIEADSCEVLNQCILTTRCNGRIAVAADYCYNTNGFLLGPLIEKGITLRGGRTPHQAVIHKVWQHCQELDPSLCILSQKKTARDTAHRLEDGPMLYKQLFHKKGGLIKVVLNVADTNTSKCEDCLISQTDVDSDGTDSTRSVTVTRCHTCYAQQPTSR
jgi:threonine dehydrogenase-like Zn-dependent dehydrogenase